MANKDSTKETLIESEKDLEKKLTKLIKIINGTTIKVFSPYMAGLPDRMCLLPGGIIFFAEIKTTGKKLRALQEVFKKQLEGLGFHYYVIDTTDKLLEMLLNENENGGHRNITYNLVSGADNFEDKLLDEYCCTIEYFKKESVECLIQDGLIKYMKGDLILTEHPEENIYALQEIKT